MTEYDDLAKAVELSGNEICWFGAASEVEVARLERSLAVLLPHSLKKFLLEYGGGGVVSAEVSGIENDDATLMNGGTVLGDTIACRRRFNLPNHLVVIYFHDDEVCWCLDSTKSAEGEYPVVSYSVFAKEVDGDIAGNFREFMNQHLMSYAQ